MREIHWLPFCLAITTAGCATQRQTGAALVGAGAVTAVVGAQAASSSYCSGFGCYHRTPAAWGTKAAVAGAAVAAAGYALMALAPRGDVQMPRSTIPPPAPGEAWRLRRRDPPPDPTPSPPEELVAPAAPPPAPAVQSPAQ